MHEILNKAIEKNSSQQNELKVDTSKELNFLDVENNDNDIDYSSELNFLEDESIDNDIDYSKELNFLDNEQPFYLEKQDQLFELNKKLVSHLEQAGIKDALIYEPHSEKYWKAGNIRIDLVNVEPFSTDGNYEKGINKTTRDNIDAWSDGNPSIRNDIDINYLIRFALKNNKELTSDDVSQLKEQLKPGGKNYFNKFEEWDKSSYNNFRYSIPTDSSDLSKHEKYILDKYTNDPFYAQIFKDKLEIRDPHVILISSKFNLEIVDKIYPELKDKLTYCGEPVIYDGRLFISMPHPGGRRHISDSEIADVVNKIVQNIDKVDDVKISGLKDSATDFNPDKKIEKREPPLAGIEKGREMTFAEADSGNVNPLYEKVPGYSENCQTCVVAFEARRRGYDIAAGSFCVGTNSEKLAEQTNLAWLTPEGKHPDYIYNLDANTTSSVYDFISETVKPGERYTLQGIWENQDWCAHILSVFREENGNLVFYDPQANIIFNENSFKEDILNYMKKGNTEETAIKLLRVDNLEIDTDFVNSIVRRSMNYA